MTRTEPDDFVRPRVDALAQLILQDASDDLSLVKRTRVPANALRVTAVQTALPRQQTVSPLTLASDTEIASKRYLEDLVSIAVASAERADTVLMKANATHVKSVRAIGAFAAIATAGIVAGVVAFLGSPAAEQKAVGVAGQVQTPEQQHQLSNQQLAVAKPELAGQSQAMTTPQQAAAPARSDASEPQQQTAQRGRVIAVPGGQPIIATPLSPLHDVTYSAPWPGPTDKAQATSPTWPRPSDTAYSSSSATLWPSRTYAVHPASIPQNRRAEPPPFIVAIQRGFRALFR